jgi:hypothetical protein
LTYCLYFWYCYIALSQHLHAGCKRKKLTGNNVCCWSQLIVVTVGIV